MRHLYRPICQSRPTEDADRLAGGALYFSRVEVLPRGEDDGTRAFEPLSSVPDDVRQRLRAERKTLFGFDGDGPMLMGVLNVTPDSFSDGGIHNSVSEAVEHAREMVSQGAHVIDIGGESTRPGAQEVPAAEELNRTIPVITAIRAAGIKTPISIDTRKAVVAEAAVAAGADMINDVSALSFDKRMLDVVARSKVPICLMHAQGDPKTMQENPVYEDVVHDVYDYLETRIALAEKRGIPRERIVVDPGIGFGKTQDHNLTLMRNIGVFHGLGCPILLGVSRKRFIGSITGVQNAADRALGSAVCALEGVRQGVQIVRVHDIEAHGQAMAMWRAMN